MGRESDAGNATTNPWEDLIIAMLSVNNYPLDKTFAIFESLKENGLLDPTKLATFSPEEFARRLTSAGYNRGDVMTAIFRERLVSLSCLPAEVPIDKCSRILSVGSREEVAALLSQVKGIGPKVMENFFLLRGDS